MVIKAFGESFKINAYLVFHSEIFVIGIPAPPRLVHFVLPYVKRHFKVDRLPIEKLVAEIIMHIRLYLKQSPEIFNRKAVC